MGLIDGFLQRVLAILTLSCLQPSRHSLTYKQQPLVVPQKNSNDDNDVEEVGEVEMCGYVTIAIEGVESVRGRQTHVWALLIDQMLYLHTCSPSSSPPTTVNANAAPASLKTKVVRLPVSKCVSLRVLTARNIRTSTVSVEDIPRFDAQPHHQQLHVNEYENIASHSVPLFPNDSPPRSMKSVPSLYPESVVAASWAGGETQTDSFVGGRRVRVDPRDRFGDESFVGSASANFQSDCLDEYENNRRSSNTNIDDDNDCTTFSALRKKKSIPITTTTTFTSPTTVTTTIETSTPTKDGCVCLGLMFPADLDAVEQLTNFLLSPTGKKPKWPFRWGWGGANRKTRKSSKRQNLHSSWARPPGQVKRESIHSVQSTATTNTTSTTQVYCEEFGQELVTVVLGCGDGVVLQEWQKIISASIMKA